MQFVLDPADDHLTTFCGQTHGKQQFLSRFWGVYSDEGFQHVVLPFGSQAEYAVCRLRVEQVGFLGRAPEHCSDTFALTVSLELQLVAEVNALKGTALGVADAEPAGVFSPLTGAGTGADSFVHVLG